MRSKNPSQLLLYIRPQFRPPLHAAVGFILLNEVVMVLHILHASSPRLFGLSWPGRPLLSLASQSLRTLISNFQLSISSCSDMMKTQLLVFLSANLIVMALLCMTATSKAARAAAGAADHEVDAEDAAGPTSASCYFWNSLIAQADDDVDCCSCKIQYIEEAATEEDRDIEELVESNLAASSGSDIVNEEEKPAAAASMVPAASSCYAVATMNQGSEMAAKEAQKPVLAASDMSTSSAVISFRSAASCRLLDAGSGALQIEMVRSEELADCSINKLMESLSNEEVNERFSEFAARKWARIRSSSCHRRRTTFRF
ncbi:hypothetical protein L7F22_022467 [Adiantum nelumboides]|nr:hypothetical protein [Adiantum nelumboides]